MKSHIPHKRLQGVSFVLLCLMIVASLIVGLSVAQAALPGDFSMTSPSNQVNGQSTNLTLIWETSSGATSYEYCIDTSNNAACDGSWISTGSNTFANLTGLTHGTVYSWQVRAINTDGITNANSGRWYTFATDYGIDASIPVGASPMAVGVNPLTNKVYVANRGESSVTVIDGATYSPIAIPVGNGPIALAVNPATNRVYAANIDSDSVSIIVGDTNAVLQTIPVGDGPRAIAVNPVTNKIFVANENGNNVTVIDGDTLQMVAIPVGAFPGSNRPQPDHQ